MYRYANKYIKLSMGIFVTLASNIQGHCNPVCLFAKVNLYPSPQVGAVWVAGGVVWYMFPSSILGPCYCTRHI